MSADVERLRELAEAATPGPWFAHFGVHGDPLVVTDPQRPHFTLVSTPSEDPDDYGRANCEFIAAANPAAILVLIVALAAARAELADLRADLADGSGAWP